MQFGGRRSFQSHFARHALARLDGRDRIVSASSDTTVRDWDLDDPTNPTILEGHTGAVVAACLGRLDGRDRIVSTRYDNTVATPAG